MLQPLAFGNFEPEIQFVIGHINSYIMIFELLEKLIILSKGYRLAKTSYVVENTYLWLVIFKGVKLHMVMLMSLINRGLISLRDHTYSKVACKFSFFVLLK